MRSIFHRLHMQPCWSWENVFGKVGMAKSSRSSEHVLIIQLFVSCCKNRTVGPLRPLGPFGTRDEKEPARLYTTNFHCFKPMPRQESCRKFIPLRSTLLSTPRRTVFETLCTMSGVLALLGVGLNNWKFVG